MKKLLIALGLLVAAVVLLAVTLRNQRVSQNSSAPAPMHVAANPPAHPHDGDGMGDHAATGRVPAYYETAPDVGRCRRHCHPRSSPTTRNLLIKQLKKFLKYWPNYPVIATAIEVTVTRACTAASNPSTVKTAASASARQSWRITFRSAA